MVGELESEWSDFE